MDQEEIAFRPPYMSFQTFWNFIEELAAKPLPPRVDRSLMSTRSGTDQANITMALTSFGFTDGEGQVQRSLRELAAQPPEDRLAALGEALRRSYVGPLRVSSQNGTSADLTKVFNSDYPSIASSDTRRKAITFFLHAARATGIELSPHFPSTRTGATARGGSGNGGPKPRKSGAPGRRKPTDVVMPEGPVAAPEPPTSQSAVEGERKTVTFGTAGEVSVVVNVRWLDLPDDVFVGLRKVIRDLDALGYTDPPGASGFGSPPRSPEGGVSTS